jgi:hypothetical protein
MTDDQIDQLLTNFATIASALTTILSQNQATPVPVVPTDDSTPLTNEEFQEFSRQVTIAQWKQSLGATTIDNLITKVKATPITGVFVPSVASLLPVDTYTLLTQKVVIEQWKTQYGEEKVNEWLKEISPDTTVVI